MAAPATRPAGCVVAVSTNPAIDRVALADGAAGGGLVRARELLETPGGKGAHVALVARELGADARLVTSAGGPRGALLSELLARAGVPATLVPVAPQTRATYTVVDPVAADVLEVHEPTGALSGEECERLIAAAVAALEGAAVAVISGSLPPGVPPDLHARLVRAANAAGAFTVLDTSTPAAFAEALAERPDLAKPNAAEAGAPADASIETLHGFTAALRARGAAAVWLSAGAAGSVLAGADGAWHLSLRPAGSVVNAVGCGDALLGGLAAGLVRGLALLDAAALGVAAAADKLRHLHSGRVERAAVEPLLARVTRRRLG